MMRILGGKMTFLGSILVGAKTDIGFKRKNNEDSYVVIDAESGHCKVERFGMLFAVADGMGGHAAGETASRMACEGLIEGYYGGKGNKEPQIFDQDLALARLVKVFNNINRDIFRFSSENEGYGGMGTTVSVLVLRPERLIQQNSLRLLMSKMPFGLQLENSLNRKALIAHVGDSRVYRMRNDLLEQLTVDHTRVQHMIETGRLSPEEAVVHPLRNVLLQAVGVEEKLVKIFTRVEDLEKGDVFVLCSDGLNGMVSDDVIREILITEKGPREASSCLVKTALKNGGKDNVTVIVVKVG